MELLIQQLVNGLAVGSIYALIALGYTMVYGTIKLINFAHGDVLFCGKGFEIECIPGFTGSDGCLCRFRSGD